MAKAPIPGNVKTRLVPPLTEEQAAQFSRALLIDLLNSVKELSAVELYLFYAPDGAKALMQEIAGHNFHLLPQRGEDLGARMQAVFTDLCSTGHRKIVLTGSDFPPFPLEYLAQAFDWLETSALRIVLGPSGDGGYYLIGMNQPTPEIFADMTWSHDAVLARTLEKLAVLNIETKQLPVWFDVDTPADFEQLRRSELVSAAGSTHTFEFLRGLGESPLR
jgi:uncharacterized protein